MQRQLVTIAILVLAGCPSKGDRQVTPASSASSGGASPSSATSAAVAGARAYVSTYRERPVDDGKSLEVHVTFSGQARPNTWEIPKEYLAHCDTTEVAAPSLALGAGGGVDGVVVWLDDIHEGKPLKDEGRIEQDQKGCAFAPHVLAMRAPGELRLMNSDPANHAVRMDFDGSAGLDEALDQVNKVVPPHFSVTLEVKPEWAGHIAKVTCPMHLWMWSYVHFFEHPYFAVTKDGAARLTKVPPGAYHLTVWHEGLGATFKDTLTVTDPKSTRVAVTMGSANVVKSFAIDDDGVVSAR